MTRGVAADEFGAARAAARLLMTTVGERSLNVKGVTRLDSDLISYLIRLFKDNIFIPSSRRRRRRLLLSRSL